MSTLEDLRAQARATWAAGDLDGFSALVAPVGALVLERSVIEPGIKVLDVGTGCGGNFAIPAAQKGASVVGLDVTPELFVHARRRADEAGVDIDWVEGDAQELPFADESFDRVVSTFGSMFAPDHARAAAELVRVCGVPGRVIMTTWRDGGFAGGLFNLMGAMLSAPPPGVQPPSLWGVEQHAREMFACARVRPTFERQSVEFCFASVDAAVAHYERDFGPLVMARAELEPQGHWEEFRRAFAGLLGRFNSATNGAARIESEYLVISVDR